MPAKKVIKAAKVVAKSKVNKVQVKATSVTVVKKGSKSADTKKKSEPKAKPLPTPKKTPAKKDPSPPKAKRTEPVKPDPQPSKDDKKVKKTESKEQIVKVITKGGAAVDSFVPNSSNYRVLSTGGKVYAATLNQSNLDANNNKFYIIQILVHETNGAIFVWNRWGRVGVPGQNVLKGPFPQATAINDYTSKFRAKTSGGYREIEIKYDEEDDKAEPQVSKKSKGPKKQVKSKMDAPMQNLMNLIFDVNVINSTMKQIGYDAKRMPLGKLGDSTIKQAYTILKQLTQAIKNGEKAQYKPLSSQFYTLIPHNFGFANMANFVLDNEEKVKEKLKMLETISDMKITTKLLQQKNDVEESPHDQNYKKLGCSIKTLNESSSDYKTLKEYFDNTKGHYSQVKVGDIFEVVRPTEEKNYNTKFGNDMLLWHGSRLSNFVGILSQGLRIAPPEAPASGYLFGKGIYLADMAEKSINYCRSHGSDTALILLIEGAIGNPNILKSPAHNAKELMQKAKKDSTKCHGSKAPPESSYVKIKNAIVPKGKGVATSSGSYMGHNEYIVYKMQQARIKYIMRMDMRGN